MSWVHHCQMAEDIATAAAGCYHRFLHRLATAERPYLNPYAACDCRAATETMERGMKLVVDVPDQVRRRGLSLHRHGREGWWWWVGVCAQLSIPIRFHYSDSFPRVACYDLLLSYLLVEHDHSNSNTTYLFAICFICLPT